MERVEIFGDPAGLRDLARWFLALSDEEAPTGAHVHLDPGNGSTMRLACDIRRCGRGLAP
jgi:hypothetical protein